MRRFTFQDTFLNQLSGEQYSSLMRLLKGWDLLKPDFLKRLDRWFANFCPEDKELAFKILINIDYYSIERFYETIADLRRKVIARLKEVDIDDTPILLATPVGEETAPTTTPT